jgi:hypothetical protein
MEEKTTTARCVECRADIAVPDTYAQGDHIRCGTCGTAHKVVRAGVLRLVLIDLGPLKQMVRENAERLERLEDELRGARGRLGMGVHGLYLGAFYVGYQVLLQNGSWTTGLIATAIAIAIGSGIVIEVLNFLFLTKRHRIERLSAEIEEVREAGRELRQKLREATRV